jgi:hypothetical protein
MITITTATPSNRRVIKYQNLYTDVSHHHCHERVFKALDAQAGWNSLAVVYGECARHAGARVAGRLVGILRSGVRCCSTSGVSSSRIAIRTTVPGAATSNDPLLTTSLQGDQHCSGASADGVPAAPYNNSIGLTILC